MSQIFLIIVISIVAFFVVSILVFFLIRSILLWYWKISEIVANQEKIISLLEKIKGEDKAE